MGGVCQRLCRKEDESQLTDLPLQSSSQDVPDETTPPEDPLNINLQWQGTSQAVLEETLTLTSKPVVEEIPPASEDDVLYIYLREDLITHYREHESQIPAAPLIEEHKVNLEDLYVIPPLWTYDDPYYFGPDYERQTRLQTSVNNAPKRQRATVSQIFSSGNVRYRKIYITANAGFGKTSLSQKLTMTWCQAHNPLESLAEKYEDVGLDAMKYFDLLFMLHLRDYQSENKCNLDDLIMQMVAENLSRNTLYTQAFLQRLLHEKKCLIVIDGLDEWVHPVKCNKIPAVPHNNHPNSCTVITTSRPWKLGTIGLSKNHIDRHVEIAELDEETFLQLFLNASRILNDNQLNLAGKDISDFFVEVGPIETENIISIPYILLQLICLFFGGLPIGKSKCEIYSNITEFTLKRGLNKKNLPYMHVHSRDNTVVPNCMKENETCKLYINLIMKLGKLAFFELFSEKKESSLIFDSKVVTKYMTEQEIDFCLKVGLLCQTKDNSILVERRYKVFFQHKSVQEFFSAIYVTSEWENHIVKLTILNACSSLTSTLEMTNLFVFVCGMNHEVYTCISGELQKIVDLDIIRHRFRSDKYIPYESIYANDFRTIQSYQSMQVQCFQECVRNRNESCLVHLYDIVLDDSLTEDDLTALQTIMNKFSGNLNSLQLLYPDEKKEDFLKSLDPGVFTSLETLRVERCDKEPVWVSDILTEYDRRLKCLKLVGPLNGNRMDRMYLSDISIKAIIGLTCLQSFYLFDVRMNHSNLKCLYAYINQNVTLNLLQMEYIDCSDHMNQYHRDCDVNLDLHLLNELMILLLVLVPCRELVVNPKCLENLYFAPLEKMMTDSAIFSLLEGIRTAPVLTSLGLAMMPSSQMIQINHTLTQLQHQLQFLMLNAIDMGDVIPLSPAWTKLERVHLVQIAFSYATWRVLFHSVGHLPQSITVQLTWTKMSSHEWTELLLSVRIMPQTVTVELKECDGPTRGEWKTIVDVIKSTPTLSLLQDLRFDYKGRASLTLKKTTTIM